jgi:tRNA 2-thiouridine synthesizing protein E
MNSTASSSPGSDDTPDMESFLDSDGFFREPEAWTPDIARHLARLDGLPALTEDHWHIIEALREHFHRFGAGPPAFAHLCARMEQDEYCVVRLFGSEREAWRIAGIPNPGEEAKAYL